MQQIHTNLSGDKKILEIFPKKPVNMTLKCKHWTPDRRPQDKMVNVDGDI